MEYTTMWAYLWDLVDDGIDRALGRIQDEAGVGAVSIATAYHTVQHLRPQAPGSKFFCAHEAALYFPPDRPRYRETPLQPRVSPLVVGGNPLRQVSERCAARGLGLISWTVTLHNSHLGGHYPEVAVQNVFGDTIREALCPAQEPVRAYVRALVDDLTANYQLRAVELESLCYPTARHYHGHEKLGIVLGPVEQLLLCLCFCPACRRRVGERVAVDDAAYAARVTLEATFATGNPCPQTLAQYLEAQPALAAYLEARQEVVTSLVQELKAVCRAELIYLGMGDWHLSGADPRAIADSVERLETLCYHADAERTGAAVEALGRAAGDPRRVTIGLCAYPPASPDAETLQANACAAAAAGAGALSFYHYGIMPRSHLEWVRQAVAAVR
ncbi:MAG: hypothetical protein GX774_14630 [Armatimonadetes bacterium]|nr:hypothetical protein [Armatimonadota bacterium]